MTTDGPLPLDPSWSDPERLAALASFAILDTPREVEFDDIVALAATACATPIAVINLIAEHRQWFKAEIGVGGRESSLDVSICARAVLRPGLTVLPDLAGEDCLAGNPLISIDGGLRFYAGVALVTADGFIVGTLCVLDRVRRPAGLTQAQSFTLLALARQAMSQLELRRLIARRDDVLVQQRRLEQARAASDEALRQMTRELEQRVLIEVAAREAAQATLMQSSRMEALGQLASGIAHDFNNVLQAASGALRLIQKRAADPVAVKRLSGLGIEVIGRGAAITGRLLAFARKGELQVAPIDMPRLLAELEDVLRHALGSISVSIAVDPHLPLLLADRNQLEIVLINLATNARDAMPEGGTLSLSADCEEICAHDERAPGRYIRLTARDTGIGMAAATLARATEPFFTTKDPGRGTGLGLAMARGFAEQSGGGFAISSAPGAGTTVSLWLPCAAVGTVEARAVQPPSPAAWDQGLQPQLLLVDDDHAVRSVLEAELAAMGYAVRSAESGAAALEILGQGARTDLLVTDLAMPGMDGVALIVAARLLRPALPAILLTGYVGDAATRAVGDALTGSVTLLRKPISGAGLGDCVAALIEEASARAAPTAISSVA